MRVSLFITCFNDTLFPETGKAVVRLLERLGHTVDFPLEQTCCGQAHFNTGYQLETIPLARRFVQVFGNADIVVAPSASCVGLVRDFSPRVAELAGDQQLTADVAALLPRVYELTELLTHKLGVEDVGAYFPHRVTYHPTCHSLRVLRLGDAPLRLLRAVRGIDVVELPHADECCGFGGTFAVKNADTSMAMLSDKVRHVLDTRAEVCVSADTSCLMQIGGALHRQRAGMRTAHIAEILASVEEDERKKANATRRTQQGERNKANATRRTQRRINDDEQNELRYSPDLPASRPRRATRHADAPQHRQSDRNDPHQARPDG
jgi:L-lactate dehydrogenase complex protein LldE